ncbi:MAG TPA: class I SAM-dependent methyltransferase, partial [Blastocatellia bacterium]|nr:class I SAM-dependent methyltransferase [Blastocatellia bacterium]
MLKMYHRQNSNGGSAAFWEETWNDGGYEEALRFCETDPLRVIFEQYAKAGSLMLEGGCGRGQYVSFYSRRGVDVVGLDFACDTLSRLREREEKLPLCGGNVAALPFRDQSFDVYFSNGVVEHFEDGAGDALREAWRVLRPHGTFLVSVPYLSPLRRAASIVKKSDRRTVTVASPDGGQAKDDRVFFQYAYRPAEFERLLADAGFRVLSTFGYSIVWGLYDLPFFDRAMHGLQGMRN